MSSEAPEQTPDSGLSADPAGSAAPQQTPQQAVQPAGPVVPVIAGTAGTPHPDEQIGGAKRRTGLHPLRLVLAVTALGLAVALGLVNQTSADTDLALRLPALLAALVLFGQGVLDLWRGLPHRWSFRAGAQPSVAEAPPQSETAAWVVPALLGVWLGCADLVVDSSSPLRELALISAFVLFGFGWIMRPAPIGGQR